MEKEGGDKLQKLILKTKEINEIIKDIMPLAETYNIKKFGRKSAHITLEGKYIGRKAMVVVLPKMD